MNAVRFLQDLVKVDSSNPPGNEHEVTKLLVQRCVDNGIDYKVTEVESNRTNFEMHIKGNGTGKKIIFNGHTDTVLPGEQPWDYSPFSAELVGDKMYGRGTTDMKSGLCAMYLAVETLIKEEKQLDHDIIFLATVGEEVNSIGAQHYLDEQGMEDVEALIIGEPTRERVVVGHKGALWLEIVTKGKTAHGSMPANGINAVEWMQKVMQVIEGLKEKWKTAAEPLGESSVSINKIDGGMQTNVIPDHCSINVDIRTVPPQNHNELLAELDQELKALFAYDNAPEYKVNMLLDRPSVLTDEASPVITKALEITNQDRVGGVPFYTDGAVLNADSKIPTLIYGPGDDQLAHQPNEYVDVNAYLRSIEVFKELAIRMGTIAK